MLYFEQLHDIISSSYIKQEGEHLWILAWKKIPFTVKIFKDSMIASIHVESCFKRKTRAKEVAYYESAF